MDEQRLANLRAAIGLVTASQANDGGRELASLVDEPIPQAAVDLIAGLVSLCGLLLFRLEMATGVAAEELIRAIATRDANP